MGNSGTGWLHYTDVGKQSASGFLTSSPDRWSHPNEHYNDPLYWFYRVRCTCSKAGFDAAPAPAGWIPQGEVTVDSYGADVKNAVVNRFNIGCSTPCINAIQYKPYNPLVIKNTDFVGLSKCCVDNDLDIQKFCPGDYNPISKKCDDFMFNNCSHQFTKGMEKQCLNWCYGNMGRCDSGMNNYCNNHPDETSCNCINSKIVDYSNPPNPSEVISICADGNCISQGYKTLSMLNFAGKCPNICSQNIRCLDHSKCNLSNTKLNQNCPDSMITKNIDHKDTKFSKNTIIFLIIFIVLVYLSYSIYASYSHTNLKSNQSPIPRNRV